MGQKVQENPSARTGVKLTLNVVFKQVPDAVLGASSLLINPLNSPLS